MSGCPTGTVFLRMGCEAPESVEGKKGLLSKGHTFLKDGRGRSSSTACQWRGWRGRLLHHGHPAPQAGRAVRQAAVLAQVPSPGTLAESSPLCGKMKSELMAGPCGACFLQLSVQTGQHNETQFCRACFVAGDPCQHWNALLPYREVPV